MKEHIMNLYPTSFEKTKSGLKTIELRLYDEKRQEVNVGDTITFYNTENELESVTVKVKAIHIYESFKELYENLPLLKCGYNEETVANASYEDMDAYYTKEKQKMYKAMGIEIEKI